MNEKEINVKERNTEEKIKNFWKNFKENWLWVTIGIYIGITSIGWIMYFRGCFSLIEVVLYTFLASILLFSIYYISKLKSGTIFRILWILGGAFVIGVWIFFSVNYILFASSWAPFHEIDVTLRRLFTILVFLLSYCGAAYIMYRIEKKIKWRFFL